MTAPTLAIASGSAKSRSLVWWIAPIVVVAVAGGLFWAFSSGAGAQAPQTAGQFVTIAPMDVEIKIVRDGDLQAVDFVDIKSQVESATQVLEVVREGASVKKGEVICTMDSSQLEQRKEDLSNQIIKAESALQISKEVRDIQESQNATNLEAAEVNVNLAEIQLRQYAEGTYPQQLQNSITALEMAKINLKNRQEDLDQTQTLNDRGFVTAADVKTAELNVRNARNEVSKAETSLRVLTDYQDAFQQAQLQSSLAQAKQRLARTVRENQSLMMQRNADVNEKEQSLLNVRKLFKKVTDQIDACSIRAPQDGLVIFASTVDNQREPLQDGSTVRQSQWLFRLPNIERMKAVVNLNDTQKVRIERAKQPVRAKVSIIGISKPIGATLDKISVLPDNRARFQNPDRRDYPCELILDETPAGLKPGTKCDRVEILLDRLEQVIAVPLACIYSIGSDSYIFVRQDADVKERKVTLGAASDSYVQIVSGLEPGEQILQLQAGQGKLLLAKAGIGSTDAKTGSGGSATDQANGEGRRGAGRGSRGAGGGGGGGGGRGAAASGNGGSGSTAAPSPRGGAASPDSPQ
jgi:HlyD family secretion protein